MSHFACLSDNDTLRYVIHHVFLPPGLPSGDDYEATLDSALIELVLKSLMSFRDKISQDGHSAVDVALATMEKLKRSRNRDGNICETSLLQLLLQLQPGKITK